jgi:hypothetical protein
MAVFWRRGIDVTLRSMTKYHIDTEIKDDEGRVWRFTRVYGESESDQKHKTWEDLRDLKTTPSKPWLCVGDFNEILFSHEKEGGRSKSRACMDRFREALEFCELHDLGFDGDMFTWRNHNHRAAEYIRERLDRAVANVLWRVLFPGVRVINGDPRHSDHRPIIVSTEIPTPRGRRRAENHPFHFEASWLGEEKCVEVVMDAWKGALEGDSTSVHAALGVVAGGLMDWSRNLLGDLEKINKKLKKDLERCRKCGISGENIAREEILRYRLEKLEE